VSTLYRTLGEHTLQDSRRAHSTELEASTLYRTLGEHTLQDSKRALYGNRVSMSSIFVTKVLTNTINRDTWYSMTDAINRDIDATS
jgi:hypothetical protein